MTVARAVAALTVCCTALMAAAEDQAGGPCDSKLEELTKTGAERIARELYTCAMQMGPKSAGAESYYEKLKAQGVQPYAAYAANNLAVRKLNRGDFKGAQFEAKNAIERLESVTNLGDHAPAFDDRAIQSDLRLNLGRAWRGMKKCGPGLQNYAEGLQRAVALAPGVMDEAISFTRECADPNGLPVSSWLSLEDSIALALRGSLGGQAALMYVTSLAIEPGAQEKDSPQSIRKAGLMASLAGIYAAGRISEPGETVDMTIPAEAGKPVSHPELDDVRKDIGNAFTGGVWSGVTKKENALANLPYAKARMAETGHPFLRLLLIFENSDRSYYDRAYLHTLSRILLQQGLVLAAQHGGTSGESLSEQGIGCLMAAWWIDNSNSEAARVAVAYLTQSAQSNQRGLMFEQDILEVDRTQKLRRGLRAYLGARADEQKDRIGPDEFSDIVETLSYINQGGISGGHRSSKELLRIADETTKSVNFPIPDVLMTLADEFKNDPDRGPDLYRRAAIQYAELGQEASFHVADNQWQALSRTGPKLEYLSFAPSRSTTAEIEVSAPLVEGDVVIRGNLTQPPEDEVTLVLEIRESFQCNPQLPEDRLLKYRQTITLRRGQMEFYFELPKRLVSGQVVFVRDEARKFRVSGPNNGIVVTSLVRALGNVRMYAAAAANLDGTVFPRFSLTSVGSFVVPRIDGTGACRLGWLGFGLSTYSDFRIEPLSVSAIPAGSTRAGGTTRPGYAMEGGIFMPILVRPAIWRFVDKTIGTYIGPLVKAGLEGTKQSVPNQVNPGPFFYRAFGVRTGYSQYFPTASAKERSTAPLNLVSFDATAGRWDRFALLNGGAIRVPWRVELTATLTAPTFPIWVGGSLNFATSGPQVSEIRAYVGFKIEVLKSLANSSRRKSERATDVSSSVGK